MSDEPEVIAVSQEEPRESSPRREVLFNPRADLEGLEEEFKRLRPPGAKRFSISVFRRGRGNERNQDQ